MDDILSPNGIYGSHGAYGVQGSPEKWVERLHENIWHLILKFKNKFSIGIKVKGLKLLLNKFWGGDGEGGGRSASPAEKLLFHIRRAGRVVSTHGSPTRAH
eukprot:398812-Amorphochlora_amoeboformis.AAC.2